MGMPRTLMVKHTVTYTESPLLELANLPGEGAELTPADARAIAAALLAAADDCEVLHTTVRLYGPVRRQYSIEKAHEPLIAWANQMHRQALVGEQLQRQSSLPQRAPMAIPQSLIEATRQKRAASRLRRQQAQDHTAPDAIPPASEPSNPAKRPPDEADPALSPDATP